MPGNPTHTNKTKQYDGEAKHGWYAIKPNSYK